ncbi:Armadillo-type fold [Phytophthora cactorum]|nr:Armadillo-type fold [Phytophthora cactorum]
MSERKRAVCASPAPDNPELLPVEDMENRLNDLMGETHWACYVGRGSVADVAVAPPDGLPVVDRALYPAPKRPRDAQELSPGLHVLQHPCPWLQSAKNNAAYSVLIEASPAYKLREQAVALLARFISVTEPNIRYVGLDSMYRMVRLDGDGTSVKQHQETVLFSLKDADPSEIVGELVNYLAVAERTMSTVPTTGPVSGIREEIVLKAAILAEKYARDLRWYVDTVLQLLTIAGSEVPDAVWHRVVQIVTNREELQRYAAEQMFKAMEPRYVDETTTKFGAYVLGEFGYLLCDDASMSGTRQFEVLHQHYVDASVPTKGVLLTAFVKMDNLYEELRSTVHGVLAKAASNMNLEIQQRACEYLALRQLCQSSPNGEEVLRAVLEPMPVFPENRESGLIVRLRNQQKAAAGGDGAVLPEEGAVSPRVRVSEQPAAADGAVDLLSLDEPVAPKTSPAFGMGGQDAIRGPNPASTDLGDIFGGGSSGGKPAGLDASLTPQIAVWARNLMLNPQGVLVETDVLQIGAKHEYRGSQGRINLFYGNKTTTRSTQAKQQIMIEAMAPFTEPPIMTVNFSRNGTSYSYQVALPCQATSFMEPVAVNEDAFLQRWNALEGQDREQQEVVPAASKLDMTQARDLSGAGTFRTGAMGPNGDKLSVGCLVRLEASDGNAYRIRVRAVHRDVSGATKNCLKMLLQV